LSTTFFVRLIEPGPAALRGAKWREEDKIMHTRRITTKPSLLAAGGALALLVTACGGGSAGGGGVAGGGAGAASSSASPPSATGGATVTTASGPDGVYLTDGTGRTLYLWVADKAGASTCSGSCAAVWPPLTTKTAPAAAGAAKASDLGTVARSDGSTQVTYDGHPLYYYASDSKPGDVTGQGSNGFGAKWWIVAPSGVAITAVANGSSGDYGY
jgi:predicted lipoprotein with Yx(FWY)xxD motif